MGSFSKNAALLALGLWLGMAGFFGGVVAPTIFKDHVENGLSRETAASTSNAILKRVYRLTYVTVGVAAFFLLMACFSEASGAKGPRRALLLCILVLGINTASDLWIADHIKKIQNERTNSLHGDAVELKQQFDTWHKAATTVYGVAVGAGLLAAVFLLPSVTGSREEVREIS